jgi:crotonobetainyl-CoA:carnitine CoA-transferase CaiB-like acyl-CoA transferase
MAKADSGGLWNAWGLQEIVEHIKTADVLVEQFRPGAMEGFNLSFETVKKINPNIVYISVTVMANGW